MSEIKKLVERIEKEIEYRKKLTNILLGKEKMKSYLTKERLRRFSLNVLEAKLEGVKEGIEAIKEDMKVKERRLINKAIKLAKYLYQDKELEKLNIEREYKDLMDLTIEEDEYCLLIGQLFFIEKLIKTLNEATGKWKK